MNNQTPISWFKEYPAQLTSSPKVIMMNAAARGIYLFIRFNCWLNISEGGGIPNDDGYIQRISNCTAEEWQSNKDQILKNFQERDGELFDPALCQQAVNVFAVSETRRKAGRASGRARNANAASSAEIKTDDDGDETDKTDRLDKTDTEFASCSTSAERVLNTCSPPPSSPFDTEITSPAPEPPDGSPTSGRLAAPTSGVPLPHAEVKGSTAKATPTGKVNPDVRRLRAACVDCGGKIPNVAHVERLLAEYSVTEIEDALIEYAPQEDGEFLEYKFFVDGGAEAVIQARRDRHR